MKILVVLLFLNLFSQAKTFECEKPSDCTIVPKGCCSCNSGGENTAVALKALKAYKATNSKQCHDVGCAAAISNDWTCTRSRKECFQGQCRLIKTPRRIVVFNREKSDLRSFPDQEFFNRLFKSRMPEYLKCYSWPEDGTSLPSGVMVLQFEKAKVEKTMALTLKSSTLGNQRIEDCIRALHSRQKPPSDSFQGKVDYAIEFELIED